MILEKDDTNRDLGKKPHVCRICGAAGEFQSWKVREMLYGTKDEFEYFECPVCVCLQIAEVPEDLSKYYSTSEYYSFQNQIKFDNDRVAGNKKEKVLDVGCGNGKWLVEKWKEGYQYLRGCDPFLDSDIQYGDDIKIKKCTIHKIEGDKKFDLIHMGDSLEHVTDPLEVLQSVKRLLTPNGIVEIAIPTWPNAAFDMFKAHWFQIDAPRHIFLPSGHCLEYMAQKSGFLIDEVQYDSKGKQFVVSFFYEHGIPMKDINTELIKELFSPQEVSSITRTTEAVNEEGRGDHILVRLVHDNS